MRASERQTEGEKMSEWREMRVRVRVRQTEREKDREKVCVGVCVRGMREQKRKADGDQETASEKLHKHARCS